MFYTFDLYGWFTGESETPTDRCTSIVPPEETETLKANFRGSDWVLLDREAYMVARFPQLQAPHIVITSCTVGEAHTGHPDLELKHEDGEITIPAGAELTVNFEIQVMGKRACVDRKWRVPLQPLDFAGMPNGNARWVFARVKDGAGVLVYQTKAGVSEKLLFTEEVVNSGFKPGEQRLLLDRPLAAFVME